MQHPIGVQVFDTDDTKAVYNLSGLLMCEVLPLELGTLMHTRDDLAMFAAFGCSLRQLRVLALHTLQRFLFTEKETRVLNFFCIGE